MTDHVSTITAEAVGQAETENAMTVEATETAEAVYVHVDDAPTPLYDAVLAELGPLHPHVDTDWAIIHSLAVMALVERATT